MIKPKYNAETEISVLGTLITLGEAKVPEVQKAMLWLTEDCFYKPEAKTIFRILRRCYDKKVGFDPINMLDYLKGEDAEIFEYFKQSIEGIYFSKNQVAPRVQDLVTLANLRNQLKIMQETINEIVKEPLADEAATILRNGIGALGRVGLNKSMQGSSIEEITDRYINDYYKANDLIKTNIDFFDTFLFGGIPNQSLVTICGDTGMGKTFFSLYLMHKLTNHINDKQSLFFSLEMAEHKIWERLMGIRARKSFSKLNEEELAFAIKKSYFHPITIYEEQFRDIDTIETICRIKAIEKPLAVIVVDYLSLVDNKLQFESNHLKQSDVAQRLASLAMELNCIVIALSQANRKPSERKSNDRCPYMSDSADSSGGYRSATIWLGIDRPELHDDDLSLHNKFVVKCRKNRYGSPFEALWAFDEGIFTEVDQCNFFQKPLHEVIKPKHKYTYKNEF